MYYYFFMEWNDKIKQARLLKGISQQNVANMLGITRGCYAHYEEGIREPSITLIKSICEVLEISADYLVGINDNY